MNRGKGIGLGSISLLLIFSVLCLVLFALLTLGTARSDANMAQRAADSVKNFYAADTEAERIYSELMNAISNGEMPETVRGTKIEYSDGCIGFVSPISDGRVIEVLISMDGTIIQCEEKKSSNWTPDESVNVWAGR